MLTMKKFESILNLVKEEYPSLYSELIFIEESDEFKMNSVCGTHMIYVQNKLEDCPHTKWMYEYLRNEYQLDSNKFMYYNFIEIFAFIHEIGHLYYIEAQETKDAAEYYREYKEKAYNTYAEAWEAYRQLPNEKLADEFAVNIIKRNFLDIWAISNEITKEKAQEEYNFWNMEL